MADLYDSITARDIPANAPAVAGYGNGHWQWSAADWARFSTNAKIVISISAGWNGGHGLDCERGDASPGECPGWIRMRHAAGLRRPFIYCSESSMPDVMRACANAGLVLGRDYTIWAAHYTGSPHFINGASAVQYASPETGSGGHYDVSNITDPSWLANLGFQGGPIPQGTVIPVASRRPSGGFLVGIANTASDGDIVALHHLFQLTLFGVIDPSGQGAFVSAVRAGVPLNAIWDGWASMPAAQAYAAATSRLVAAEGAIDHPHMSPEERLDVGRAMTRLAYLLARHAEPESWAALDGWAQSMAAGSFEAGIARMFDAVGEFQDDLARDRAIRDAGPAHPPVPGPTGPPGPSGLVAHHHATGPAIPD